MIIVTGMHRSGTSLAAQVLQAIGVDFGDPTAMYSADDWNANGYLERLDVVDLNSRIITGHERTTGRIAQVLSQLSYLRMPALDEIDRAADAMAKDLAIEAALIGDLAVKDPRFCLTYGGWVRHVGVDGLVVALRHPAASVASLRKRNRLPERIGHKFWRWHMEAILPHIDEDTLLIRQDLLTGPESASEIEHIRSWCEARGLDASGDATGVVNQGLVHHQPDDSSVPPESLNIWRELTVV
jgi:hypothetical protein